MCETATQIINFINTRIILAFLLAFNLVEKHDTPQKLPIMYKILF